MTHVIIRGPLGRAGMDTRLAANYHNAGVAGFKRGMYHLWRPEWTADEQAAHFAVTYWAYQWELLPASDFEIAAANGRNLADEIRAYLLAVEGYIGIRPVIYTGKPWWAKNVGNVSWAKDYDLWLAAYYAPPATIHPPERFFPGDLPPGWAQWKMWQFTSTLPGKEWGVGSGGLDMSWRRV